jgi:glycerol-3-phosphate O-acyltransferase
MGLLGCGINAYVHNLKRKASNPKIFIVPATFSFQLVLEAETLIDDFLKEVGKARYIIEDDESARPRTVLSFLSKLLSLDSKIYVTYSPALDPFGNRVDADGNSLDPVGRTIDIERYLYVNGEPEIVADRDAEYTREVSERIVEAYSKDNVVYSTNVTAKAVFNLLRRRNPKMSLLRLLRTGGAEDDLELVEVYRETDRLLSELRRMAAGRKIRLAAGLEASAPEDVVADGLSKFSIFHSREAAHRKGDRLVPVDRNLLFYYQNRLEGYGLEVAGMKPTLASDHRALGQAA